MAKKTLSVRVVENVDKLQIEIGKLFDPLYRVSLERLQAEREYLYKRFKEVRRKRPRLVFAYKSRRSLWSVWYSPDRWEIKGRSVDEIAILSETVSRGIYDTADTLVHELAHFVNHALGIKDTSRDGRYHNTRFRYMANLFAREVDTFGRFGLAKTELTKELIAQGNRIKSKRSIYYHGVSQRKC